MHGQVRHLGENGCDSAHVLPQGAGAQECVRYLRAARHPQRVEASAVEGDGSDGSLRQGRAVGHVDELQVSDVLAQHLRSEEQNRLEDVLESGNSNCRLLSRLQANPGEHHSNPAITSMPASVTRHSAMTSFFSGTPFSDTSPCKRCLGYGC